MGIDREQMVAAVLLGLVLAFGLGLFFLIVLTVRQVDAWVLGRRPHSPRDAEKASRQPISSEAGCHALTTATDLFVIKSNLDAVSRQIEDLEKRLRTGAASPASPVGSSPP